MVRWISDFLVGWAVDFWEGVYSVPRRDCSISDLRRACDWGGACWRLDANKPLISYLCVPIPLTAKLKYSVSVGDTVLLDHLQWGRYAGRVGISRHLNDFVTATKLGTTNKIFVAATKNFAAATKRFVDRTKYFVVVTKCFCYPSFKKWFCWYKKKAFFPVMMKIQPGPQDWILKWDEYRRVLYGTGFVWSETSEGYTQ